MSVKTTTCGLIKWTEKMFEKLGWMVLAMKEVEDGTSVKSQMTRKLKSYGETLIVLEKSIELKISTVKDEDKKDDLKVELERVRTLRTFFNKNFNLLGPMPDKPLPLTRSDGATFQSGGRKRSAKKSSNKGIK
jgi:hypothetical protein